MYNILTRMEVFEMNNHNEEKYDISNFDLAASTDYEEQKMIDLFNELMDFVPKDVPDAVGYVKTILSFAESMVHGDEIDQYVTVTGALPYVSTALEKLMSSIYSKELDKYRREKRELEVSMGALREERSSLSVEVPLLQVQKKTLEDDITGLKSEKEEFQKSLEEEKARALSKLDKEIEDKRKSLNDEITGLSNKRTEITSSIQGYEEMLRKYTTGLDKIIKPRKAKEPEYSVTWESVTEEEDIYKMNANSIDDYINSLKVSYMTKMKVSKEKCDKEFLINCPALETIAEILRNDFNGSHDTLKNIIRNYVNFNVNPQYYNSVRELNSLLKSIKLPKYNLNVNKKVVWEIARTDDDIYNVDSETISDYIYKIKEQFLKGANIADEKSYCKDFYELIELIKVFGYYTCDFGISIKDIIKKYDTNNNWNEAAKDCSQKIMELMERIRVPHLVEDEEIEETDTLSELSRDDLPLNVSYAIRELKYQREILTALSEKRVAEEQLKTVIGLMAQYVPHDVDLSTLLGVSFESDENKAFKI